MEALVPAWLIPADCMQLVHMGRLFTVEESQGQVQKQDRQNWSDQMNITHGMLTGWDHTAAVTRNVLMLPLLMIRSKSAPATRNVLARQRSSRLFSKGDTIKTACI